MIIELYNDMFWISLIIQSLKRLKYIAVIYNLVFRPASADIIKVFEPLKSEILLNSYQVTNILPVRGLKVRIHPECRQSFHQSEQQYESQPGRVYI